MQQQKSFQDEFVGKLYLVPTPIGNLEDMTFRAVTTLKNVDLIAAEDTRHTQKLLNHFDIKTPQISFHEHNVYTRIPQCLEKLQQGQHIAQVSDAGMPSISDPGHELVKACIEQNIPVIALPGANAGLTALIASGLLPQPFYFHGFLPRKTTEQKQLLKELQSKTETMIFYESPFRLKETVSNMSKVWHENRQMVICRELTKKFEEYVRGSIGEVLQWVSEETVKGEICLLVSGRIEEEQWEEPTMTNIMPMDLPINEQVDWVMAQHHVSNKEAIKFVAKQLHVSKQDVYKAYHKE